MNVNITKEIALKKMKHSLETKRKLIEMADRKLLKWQTELEKTGKVTFA